MGDEDDSRALERVLRYDASFVPRFAQRFIRHLLDALSLGPRANVLDLGCRTGHPTIEILERRSDARVIALESDAQHLELARARVGAEVGRRVFFKQAPPFPLSFGDGVFSHVVANLIDRLDVARDALFGESARVLAPDGALVFTLCMSGSFIEVIDLLREVALARELPEVAERVERYARSLPGEDTLRAELLHRGYRDILVESWEFTVEHPSSESLMSDPILEFAAMPEWRWCAEGAPNADAVLRALRDTIDTYYQGRDFALTVVGGCVSCRRADAGEAC